MTNPLVFFNHYQKEAVALAKYPDVDKNMVYPALGIAGEAGEVADKIKKFWRNNGITDGAELSAGERTALVKELGDVLIGVLNVIDREGFDAESILLQRWSTIKNRDYLKNPDTGGREFE